MVWCKVCSDSYLVIGQSPAQLVQPGADDGHGDLVADLGDLQHVFATATFSSGVNAQEAVYLCIVLAPIAVC